LLDFWTDYRICTLTTLRADGRPHVVPVGAALDPEQECAWVITRAGSQKVRNIQRTPHIAICQVEGARWSTLEGQATVLDDEASVARAIERYAARYGDPQPSPIRVALRIEVERFLVSAAIPLA